MSFRDPYKTLNVRETDSLEQIERVYKGYLKLLHPDKAHRPEAIALRMSPDEKMKYLNDVVNAYETIKRSYKEKSYPDTVHNYKIDNDNTIGFNYGLDENDAKNFDPKKFNKLFKVTSKRDKEAGFADPYTGGYGDFDAGKDYNSEAKIGPQSYSGSMSVTESKNTKARKMKGNRLVEYMPDNTVYSDSPNNYQELGLTSIKDYSTKIYGKGSINGTDLMAAYGSNMETWEDTVKRDAALFSKFDDKTDIISKSNNIMSQRAYIDNLPPDPRIFADERKFNKRMEAAEAKRMQNLGFRDEYYNSVNQGRLSDNRY